MSILVLSVSHKTAPIDLLAQVAMDAEASAKLAMQLTTSEHVDEAVVLSTCNRTELYAAVSRFHGGLDDVTAAFADLHGLDSAELVRRCAVFFDEGAVAHTFGVASGLDSMVIGESQILGQVRAALRTAQQAGTVGTVLNSLFQQGIRVGKRTQTETKIGSAGRSLISAALNELGAVLGPIRDQRVAVLGAGSMAGLAARTAARHGATLTCVNRTFERAERLAAAVGGSARSLDELPAVLAENDVVITCTGARTRLLEASDLVGTPVRAVIDLGLPPDADPAIADAMPLINLERLLTSESASAPAAEVEAARALVAAEVSDFLGLRRATQVAPTVVALRSMASEVVDAELSRLDSRLPDLNSTQRAEITKTVRRVVEKLLHHPTVRIQAHASVSRKSVDYAAALRELFALDPQAVARR